MPGWAITDARRPVLPAAAVTGAESDGVTGAATAAMVALPVGLMTPLALISTTVSVTGPGFVAVYVIVSAAPAATPAGPPSLEIVPLSIVHVYVMPAWAA